MEVAEQSTQDHCCRHFKKSCYHIHQTFSRNLPDLFLILSQILLLIQIHVHFLKQWPVSQLLNLQMPLHPYILSTHFLHDVSFVCLWCLSLSACLYKAYSRKVHWFSNPSYIKCLLRWCTMSSSFQNSSLHRSQKNPSSSIIVGVCCEHTHLILQCCEDMLSKFQFLGKK